MERQYCKRCDKCRELTVVIAPISYTTAMHHDGLEYTIHVPELTVPQCSKCGSFAFDNEACIQVDAAFRKQVGLLFPQEIQSQREALHLTPQQLADHLRIDVAALERWESGMQIQSRSLDLLMRGFFKDPEFLKSLDNELDVALPASKGRGQRVIILPEQSSSETPHEIAPG